MSDRPPKKDPAPVDDLGWEDERLLEPTEEEDVWDDPTNDEDTDWQQEALLERAPAEDDLDWSRADEDGFDEALDWGSEVESTPPLSLDEPLLSEERAVIGWRELAILPDWGGAEVATRCSTTAAGSALHVEMGPGAEGFVRLVLGGRSLQVPISPLGDELTVHAVVRICGREFAVPVQLHATSGAPLLVLGRDALAGRFLVDASQARTEDGR